jgi:hypothetical protein
MPADPLYPAELCPEPRPEGQFPRRSGPLPRLAADIGAGHSAQRVPPDPPGGADDRAERAAARFGQAAASGPAR